MLSESRLLGSRRLARWLKSGDDASSPAEAAVIEEAAVLEVEDVAAPEDDLLSRVDALHASNDVDAVFEMLVGSKDTTDEDLSWRVARAHHDKAEEIVGDDARKEQLLRDGLTIAEAAVERTRGGYALKWYAILLGRLGDFLPTKEKVGNSFKIRDALTAAAELLPSDSSIQTALGQWCYKVASISWVERNAAKLLFGAPPESSYAEALAYLEASYALRPTKKATYFCGLCSQKTTKRQECQRRFRETAFW